MKIGDIEIVASWQEEDYRPLLDGIPEFGTSHHGAISEWCRRSGAEDPSDPRLWKVFAIRRGDRTIGICGLYSLYPENDDELWLGWFGLLEEFRGRGIGSTVLSYLESEARLVGCKRLFSYVDKSGKPLPFYLTRGFQHIGTVAEHLKSHPELSADEFGSTSDLVIQKTLP